MTNVIAYSIVSAVLALLIFIIKKSLKDQTDDRNKANTEIKGIVATFSDEVRRSLKEISDSMNDLKIEIASNYVKDTEFNEYKKSNGLAHSEIHKQINQLSNQIARMEGKQE
jgi:adenylosuccinate synthase